MNTSQMTLRSKLLLAFSVPMVTSVVLAFVIFFSVRGMISASHWVDHTYRVIDAAKSLSAAMVDMETGMRGFLVAGDDVFLEPYIGGRKHFDETIAQLKKTVSDNPPQVKRLDGIENLSREWQAQAAEVFIALRRQVGPEGLTMADVTAEIAKGAGKRYMDELRARINEFVGIEQQLIGVRTEEAEGLGSLTIILTFAGAVLSLLVVGIATFLLTRDVQRQLGGEPSTMQAISEQIAQGDLTVRFDTGEAFGVYAAMRNMSQNLTDIVNKVRAAASSITSSAEEIAQGNLYLSERTEQQASSLEETAASMEELTATVRQNTDNARQARELAQAASADADRGNEVVAKAVSAMSEINDSSRKIADIISMIDEIAFQTNLLALNAAVEAARAGEQGRGFAVVAAEVRTLAARSAEAASEISSLINESVTKVDEGTKLVNASGDVLNGILKGVKQLSANVSEIAISSEEQYSGIEQVSSAITQMDKVTQQNAALVEEAAAASQSMRQSAESLEQLMGFFNVNQERVGLPRIAG